MSVFPVMSSLPAGKRERSRMTEHLLQFPAQDESDSSTNERTEREALREGGYHPVRPGDTFKNGTYRALCRLGVGHFSTVWLCLDHSKTAPSGTSAPPRNRIVALKIQKSASDYKEAALDEITLLREVNRFDKDGEARVITLLDHFQHRGPNGLHVCLVFDVLGVSLLRLIKRFNYQGAPLILVRRIARHLLMGLHYLHTVAKIIHTDLKPENVLFELPADMVEEIEVQGTAFASKLIEKRRLDAVYGANTAGSGRGGKSYKKSFRKRAKQKQKRAALQRDDMDDEADANKDGVVEAGTGGTGGSGGGNGGGGDTDEKFDLGRIVKNEVLYLQGRVKIADLGNACWVHKHFTEDIQTRQYRSPEIIVGAKYNSSVDVWSAGCLIFELLTGEYLFDPHSGLDYDRDEDHLALMMELMGSMPRYLTRKGEFSRELFTRNGELRHIKRLDYFPLVDVLSEKYKFAKDEAKLIAEFLEPMLRLDPSKRATPEECLQHRFFDEDDSAE